MNELKQAMAEVALSTMTKRWYEAAAYGQSEPYDPSKLHEEIAQAILEMPAIKQALEMHYNYQGALADIESLVSAFRKRMPDDEWLNLNYPIKNTASLNGGIRQSDEASALSDRTPASGMGLPNSSDGGVTMGGAVKSGALDSVLKRGDNNGSHTPPTYTHEQVRTLVQALQYYADEANYPERDVPTGNGTTIRVFGLGYVSLHRAQEALAQFTVKDANHDNG